MFPIDDGEKVVCLAGSGIATDLPLSVEYMDRDSCNVIGNAGRHMGNLVRVVVIGLFVGVLWDLKLKISSLPFDGADFFCDKVLCWLNNVTPSILPSTIMEMGKKIYHHTAISVGDFGKGEMTRFLERMAQFQQENEEKVVIHECKSHREEMSLTAFRFDAAAALRTWCVGNNVQGFSVDYAMPKNSDETPSLGDLPAVGDANQLPLPFKANVILSLNVDVDAVHNSLTRSVGACGG